MRTRAVALLMLAFTLTPGLVLAQSASVQFNRWDAQITAQSNSDQLQIAEIQEVQVTAGTVSHGTRYWTDPETRPKRGLIFSRRFFSPTLSINIL